MVLDLMETPTDKNKSKKQWNLIVENMPKCAVCNQKLGENDYAWYDDENNEVCCKDCNRTARHSRDTLLPRFIDDLQRSNMLYHVVIRK